jgi:DNA polymerase-3 subunit delta'
LPQGTSIRIDQVRSLQSQVALRPYEGRYKVCVLDGADTLTEQAQNSMLKSLEEPPGDGVFILITHNPDAVLSTIHSRCQVLRLQPVAEVAIADLLVQKRGLAEKEAALMAALSHGLPGFALALDPQATLMQRDRVVGWCTALRQERLKAAVRIADELEREEDLAGWLTAISIWMRDLWHYHTDPSMCLVNRDLIGTIQVEAPGWGAGAIAVLTAIQNATKQLARNANKRLVLDYMLMQFQRGLPS